MEQGSLKTQFSKRAKRPEHLERLLGALEDRNVDALPLTERSKLIQHLTSAIFQEAARGKFWKVDEDVGSLRLHEPPFEREIRQIVRLLESLKLSDYAMDWAVARSKELAQALEKEIPFEDMKKRWPGLPLDEKKQVLERVAELQRRIFSKGGMDFLPCPVVLKPMANAIGFVQPKVMDIQTLTMPNINVSRHMVEHGIYLQAAYTVVHEQVHAMFIQLAIAAHRKQIASPHPLAKDAEHALARVLYYGIGTGYIKSAYEADPEEKITHAAHRAFQAGYNPPPPPPPRNLFEQAKDQAAGVMKRILGR